MDPTVARGGGGQLLLRSQLRAGRKNQRATFISNDSLCHRTGSQVVGQGRIKTCLLINQVPANSWSSQNAGEAVRPGEDLQLLQEPAGKTSAPAQAAQEAGGPRSMEEREPRKEPAWRKCICGQRSAKHSAAVKFLGPE